MRWYDQVYKVYTESGGYSTPEISYKAGKIIFHGCKEQHKTFSYEDYRSGKRVRLFGIVDRQTPGADAELLVNEIIGDLLPFDRTNDHILNVNPTDRDIFRLLDEVLRKVYKIDVTGSVGNQLLNRVGDTCRFRGIPESNDENNGTAEINQLPSVSSGNSMIQSTSSFQLLSSTPFSPPSNETITEGLGVMEFIAFYRDIIDRVDAAARADERRKMNLATADQVNLATASVPPLPLPPIPVPPPQVPLPPPQVPLPPSQVPLPRPQVPLPHPQVSLPPHQVPLPPPQVPPPPPVPFPPPPPVPFPPPPSTTTTTTFNQYDGCMPPAAQLQYPNHYPNQDPNQSSNQYPNQGLNQYPSQDSNQYSNQYPNQYPNQYSNQGLNQYPNQSPNQYPNQGPNQNPAQHPNQYANQNSNQYLNQDPNHGSNQYQNQVPSHYPNQDPSQYSIQYPNQYPNQGSNQYPNQGANQYPNRGLNQYLNQGPNQYSDQGANQYPNQSSNQLPNQYSNRYPNLQSPNREQSNQYLVGDTYPYIEPTSHHSNMYQSPPSMYPARKRGSAAYKSFITCTSPLSAISESEESERWWTEEGEYPKDDYLQAYFDMLNDTTDPTDTTTPPTCHTSTIEIPRGGNDDDEYFHTAKQRTPANVGYMGSETRKEHNAMYSSESSDLKSSSTNYSTCAEIPYSRSSAVIVFIYGNKMFIGSIGDSRIVLVRQRCHYMDVMYLNEPPLAWFPLTAAKNSCFENKRYILFQEPIIRGGFLLDEQSIFLLMFNDGVTKNMLDMERDPRTSSQINQAAVQMVNKLLEKKYRTEEISRKVIAHIRHSYSRKCKPNANAKREGMSFLYADLRPLSASVDLPDHIRVKKACLSERTLVSDTPSSTKMIEYRNSEIKSEEEMKDASSVDETYDALYQEICDHKGSEDRETESDFAFEDNTLVFIRSDLKGKDIFDFEGKGSF